MKIISMRAENIKRLVAVEICPDTNMVEITGRNGAGKTSVLDAILWALGSQKVIQHKPVRDGQNSGYVRLDLGQYVVTRKFKVKDGGEYTTSITVENAEGARYSSPQEILDGFVGQLSFDPLAFSRMKPADQKNALRALVPGFDFDANEASIKKDFAERTIVNRKVADLKARIAAAPTVEDAPAQRLSQDAVMAEIQDAMAKNDAMHATVAENRSKRHEVSGYELIVEQKKQAVSRIERELAIAKQDLSEAELALEEARNAIDGLVDPEPIDISPLRQKLTEIEEKNRRFDLVKARRELEAELKAAEDEAANLTKIIDAAKASATKAIASAELPVEGLEVVDDGILVGGVPFDQMSDAQQLQVSIAVAGAMNSKLKVIRVRDGSLLDSESMAALREYAEKADLQIWIEVVSDGEGPGIVIEDGMVKGAVQKEAAE